MTNDDFALITIPLTALNAIHRFSGKETPSLVEGEELPLAHNFENIFNFLISNKGLLYNTTYT